MRKSNVVAIYCNQDIIMRKIGRTLSKRFEEEGVSSMSPLGILIIFFRFMPRKEIKFVDKSQQICSREQIIKIEKQVSDNLLPSYAGLAQHPLPMEIITNAFTELKKHDIKVIAPLNNLANDTF